MRRLGTVERVVTGQVVVHIEGEPPSLGTIAVDETLTPVGTVIDVIGPVDTPLAVLNPADEIDPVSILGERLYLREP